MVYRKSDWVALIVKPTLDKADPKGALKYVTESLSIPGKTFEDAAYEAQWRADIVKGYVTSLEER